MVMQYAIVLLPIVPLRSDASDCAEMTSQLLFGDFVTIHAQSGTNWTQVSNLFDQYTGWVDTKMITPLTESEFNRLRSLPLYFVSQPCADAKEQQSTYPLRLSIGATLPGYDPLRQCMQVLDRSFKIPLRAVSPAKQSVIKALLRTASYYIHTPYLWGGKSVHGIDCSGFVQCVYRLYQIDLPRDASQQVHCGEPIDFALRRPGDLAFFSNEAGKVTHVGIVYTPHQIIHASGSVHIDALSEEGIYSDKLGRITHQKIQLRRVIA